MEAERVALNLRVVLYQSLSIGLFATYGAMVVAWTWAIRRFRSGQSLTPQIKPRIVRWGAPSTGAVIFAWIFARFLAGDLFLALTSRSRAIPLSFLDQMTLATLWSCLTVVVVPTVLAVMSKASLADLGLHHHGIGRQTLRGAVAFLLVAVPIYLINLLCVVLTSLFTQLGAPNKHPVEKMVRENFGPEVAYLAVLSAVVLAPAAEELVFRGVIQGWLFKAIRNSLRPSPLTLHDVHSVRSFGDDAPLESLAEQSIGDDKQQRDDRRAGWMAIVLTSTLFALAHWEQWPAPVALFFLSLALGFVFQRTGSLWSAFILHSLFNGLSTAVLFASILGSEPREKPARPHDAAITAPASTSTERPHLENQPATPTKSSTAKSQ